MTVGIQGIMSWQTWRAEVIADDTVINDVTDGFEPADLALAEAAGMVISVDTYTAIMFFPLVVADDADTCNIKIIGYMASHVPHGAGPGMSLYDAQLIAGVSPIMSGAIPQTDGKWSSQNWSFVKTVTETTDAVSATPIAFVGQNCILFPTVGFTTLIMEVTNIGGGGTEIHRFGCLWRGVSKEGAI